MSLFDIDKNGASRLRPSPSADDGSVLRPLSTLSIAPRDDSAEATAAPTVALRDRGIVMTTEEAVVAVLGTQEDSSFKVVTAKADESVDVSNLETLSFDSDTGAGGVIEAEGNSVGGWYVEDEELIGSEGAVIRAGQTDYDTGNGFFIGRISPTLFSIGNSAGDKMTWDGSFLRITGNLKVSSIFQNASYATADLPIPPTTVGFNSPAGNE